MNWKKFILQTCHLWGVLKIWNLNQSSNLLPFWNICLFKLFFFFYFTVENCRNSKLWRSCNAHVDERWSYVTIVRVYRTRDFTRNLYTCKNRCFIHGSEQRAARFGDGHALWWSLVDFARPVGTQTFQRRRHMRIIALHRNTSAVVRVF